MSGEAARGQKMASNTPQLWDALWINAVLDYSHAALKRADGFFGDNLFWSLRFINPFRVAQKVLKVKHSYSTARLKKEKGTPLDGYMACAMVLHGKK